MAARILDGAALAQKIRNEVALEVEAMKEVGVTPGLGTILVGENPASATYVGLKHKDCDELGIASFGEHLPETATQDDVHAVIARFNADPEIDAFLVQIPLPKGLDKWRIAGQGGTSEKPYPVHAPHRLRLGDERHGEEAQRASDKPAPVHYSITSSARSRSEGGIVSPSALAVLRLTTNSNLVGCSIGRSAGLAPLRILST